MAACLYQSLRLGDRHMCKEHAAYTTSGFQSSLSLNLGFLVYSTFTFVQTRLCICANRLCLGESHRDCEGKPIEGFTLMFQKLLYQNCALYLWIDILCSKTSCSLPLPILPSLQQLIIWLFIYKDILQSILLLWFAQESLTKIPLARYGRYLIILQNPKEKLSSLRRLYNPDRQATPGIRKM